MNNEGCLVFTVVSCYKDIFTENDIEVVPNIGTNFYITT